MFDPRELIDRQAVLTAIAQPPFEELRERARERHRRRTTLMGLALVLAVTGFGVPMLTGPAGQSPDIEGRILAPPSAWHFKDTRHGVVLYAEPTSSGENGCRATVRVTADSGRSWSGQQPAPCRLDQQGKPTQAVLMLDADTILTFTPDGPPQISYDAGRTWRRHTMETVTTDRIPVWTDVMYGCIDSAVCRDPDQLRWYDPATGNRFLLRTLPALDRVLGTPIWGQDGSLWVPGRTPNGQYAVAISPDQGRTWQTRPIGLKVDPHDDVASGLAVATHDGRTGYTIRDDLTLDNVLFRTVDGGQTWQRVTTEAKSYSPYNWTSGYVAADGTLVLETSGHASRWQASRDGGRTVTPLSDFPPDSLVLVLSDGYVRSGMPEDGIHLSEDGLHWRKVKLP